MRACAQGEHISGDRTPTPPLQEPRRGMGTTYRTARTMRTHRNELFTDPKTTILFGDAKESLANLVTSVRRI